MDEPRLELSAEEWEWVRYRKGYAPSVVEASVMLDLFLRVEAGRQKAEFELKHPRYKCHCFDSWNVKTTNYDPRHSWTNTQWLEAVRREKLE